jgi:uncharacterized protein YbcI
LAGLIAFIPESIEGGSSMPDTQEASGTFRALDAVSTAMVKLHKEQFGRGPKRARSNFAGPDTLVCVLEDVLLPAELKLVELGEHNRVRDARVAYQAATEAEFITAIEEIVSRKVRAFASAVDPDRNVVFECFTLEPRQQDGDGTIGT